ncbi:MAG TPA: nucleotidyltransferase family protein [Anaerolineales bacterium]|nr:nucleotidyltransferase family protein [Anaerolineales bacterium]
MDAIVTAGGIPKPGEPLYEFTQGRPKALLELAGKPMVQWVLDALGASKKVDHIVVVGLNENSGLTSNKPLYYLPNQGGMLENILAGAQKLLTIHPASQTMVSVSSDVPALTGEIMDWLVGEVEKSDHDVFYNVIPRETMENRFPGSKRTFTKFKDIEICGGDVTAFRTRMLTTEGGVWRELIEARKNVLKQAAIIGWGTFFLLFTRQLTLQGAVERVSQRLEINAKLLKSPYPEVGMDVDKPYQMEMLQNELARRRSA